MIPLYFGECFGWLHPATGGRGVVICPALGLEDLCTHRFLRHLAGQCAAAGMPTLRFDYQGTGDSLGSDQDPERVEQWIASIGEAVAWLRRETGVTQIALAGFRLGALLAAQTAASLDVERLALLAPPVSGKSYAREMKALAMVLGDAEFSQPPAGTPAPGSQAGVEVGGFTLTPATLEALARIDLSRLEVRPAGRVLIAGRGSVAAEERLAGHLRALGAEVAQAVLPGLAQMEWNSSLARLPDHAFDATVSWLADGLPAERSRQPQHIDSCIGTSQWSERAVRFGPGERLFGIECRPRQGGSRDVLLFLNHGANHHIGWARMFVTFGRRLAARGIPSLRMDIAGVGDSPAQSGQPENQLYFRGSQQDVYAALEWLREAGYERCTLVGHCAGAYLAFYAAVRDPRVSGLIMLNLQRFYWRRGDSLEDAMRRGFRSTGWYLTSLRSGKFWLRMLRGEVNVRGIAAMLAQRVVKRGARWVSDCAGWLGIGGKNQRVMQWFRELSSRGTRILLVYSDNDAGIDELANYAGPNGRRVRRLSGVDISVINGADHNITPPWAHEAYVRILERHLQPARTGAG